MWSPAARVAASALPSEWRSYSRALPAAEFPRAIAAGTRTLVSRRSTALTQSVLRRGPRAKVRWATSCQGTVSVPRRWVTDPAPRRGRRAGVGHQQRVGGSGTERPLPGRRVHEQTTEREDVRRRARRLAHGLFGRHEARCAHDRSDRGQLGLPGGAEGLADAEVDDPRTVVEKQDVGRLEVAVHQPALVERGQRLGQPGTEPPRLTRAQRTPFRHPFRERRAVEVLAGDPGDGRVRVGVDDRHRPEAARAPSQFDLPPEPVPEAGVGGDQRPSGAAPPGRKAGAGRQVRPARSGAVGWGPSAGGAARHLRPGAGGPGRLTRRRTGRARPAGRSS